MGEEAFLALLEVAQASVRLERSEVEVIRAHLAAWSARPTRAEPLTMLARYFRKKGDFANAYVFACAASNIELPADKLGVDAETYRWKALDERASASFRIGRYAEAFECNQLLLQRDLPADQRDRVAQNLETCRQRASAGSR